ncbi:hypothetical protein HAX54_008684 [Datura stramonium]|uniref:Uncharacterized protein n=1 Tax=Datura stramonium TaxID=4076 RepID=A0ABS8TDP4_DATST|nr:hypothetical protein [Datura stramonium]
MDDIVITGGDPSYISSFTKSLDLQFSLKDLGWAADSDDRHSHHGFAVYFGPNIISSSSQKKKVVAQSSSKAEYVPLHLPHQKHPR